MAERNAFGRTWWGNAWIEALEKSDIDKTRLEEGKNDAARGNVKEIKIRSREIQASVQEQDIYTSTIRLIEFTPEEKEQVGNLIRNNPSIASELSLGRLPEKLLEEMKNAGIPLFPYKLAARFVFMHLRRKGKPLPPPCRGLLYLCQRN